MTKRRRIVITGMGLVSCLGDDPEKFYDRLLNGESGIRSIEEFANTDLAVRFGGLIEQFDPGELIEKKQARRVDKCIAYALCAGKRALMQAHLPFDKSEREHILPSHRAGVLVGSGVGGMHTFFENSKALIEKGPNRVSPFLIPYILTNMPSALLGQDLGFMGPTYSISTACATSNHCIIQAAEHIRRGDADLMIAGGVEAPVTLLGVAGFAALKALSQRNENPTAASRPWDKGRDGFVMAEGAGILILESLESAIARNAPILAEYMGGGMSSDAHHMTEPRPDGQGISVCIHSALKNAGISAADIDYINAHATSTPVGDIAEIRALKNVFDNRSRITINATKSMIGHALGAAGGLEAVAVIQAIRRGKIHPTINLESPEEELDFDVPTKVREKKIRYAMSNSFGFGGHNGTVIFAPYVA